MKLSNLKIATVSAMVIAVLSLNLVNPFSSQSYDDVKGMATEKFTSWRKYCNT